MGSHKRFHIAVKDQSLFVVPVAGSECGSGKLGYVCRADAVRDGRRRRLVTGRMRAYWCSGCGRWHLGHLSAGRVAGLL